MNKGDMKVNTRFKMDDNMDASSPYSYINKFNNMVHKMDKYGYQTKYPELFPWDLKVQNFKQLPVHEYFYAKHKEKNDQNTNINNPQNTHKSIKKKQFSDAKQLMEEMNQRSKKKLVDFDKQFMDSNFFKKLPKEVRESIYSILKNYILIGIDEDDHQKKNLHQTRKNFYSSITKVQTNEILQGQEEIFKNLELSCLNKKDMLLLKILNQMDFERIQKIITIKPELHKATLKEIKKITNHNKFVSDQMKIQTMHEFHKNSQQKNKKMASTTTENFMIQKEKEINREIQYPKKKIYHEQKQQRFVIKKQYGLNDKQREFYSNRNREDIEQRKLNVQSRQPDIRKINENLNQLNKNLSNQQQQKSVYEKNRDSQIEYQMPQIKQESIFNFQQYFYNNYQKSSGFVMKLNKETENAIKMFEEDILDKIDNLL